MQVSSVLWSSRQTYVAGYLQDVWKMSPRVTLNYGLRWEPFLPLAVGYGHGANLTEGGSFQFSQDRFNRGIRSTVYPNAPVGVDECKLALLRAARRIGLGCEGRWPH